MRDLAKREGVSINQFISTALAEKLSALMTTEYLEERAKRADSEKYKSALSKVKNREPISHDRL